VWFVQCSEAYTGRLCGVCASNFFRSGRKCVTCPEDPGTRLFFIALLLLIVLPVILYIARRALPYFVAVGIGYNYWQGDVFVFFSIFFHYMCVSVFFVSAVVESLRVVGNRYVYILTTRDTLTTASHIHAYTHHTYTRTCTHAHIHMPT